jgi:hypothetical protein
MQARVRQGPDAAEGLPAAADGLPAAEDGLPAAELGEPAEPAGGGVPPADDEPALAHPAKPRVMSPAAINVGVLRMAVPSR